jgi:DNA-binding NarL/FixJ family response regulator
LRLVEFSPEGSAVQIRIYIADDHPLMREGLRSLLSASADFAVVGFGSTGRAALRDVRELRPLVVLMDISMPELNGIEATRQLAERCPECKVIILSMHATVEHYYRAMRAGAWGYVLKESAVDEVPAAVRSVAVGRRFVSRRIAEDFPPVHDVASPLEALSRREREILQLVAENHSNTRIAELLCISPKTVETYRCRLIQKLRVRGTADLVKFAIRHGITTIE